MLYLLHYREILFCPAHVYTINGKKKCTRVARYSIGMHDQQFENSVKTTYLLYIFISGIFYILYSNCVPSITKGGTIDHDLIVFSPHS